MASAKANKASGALPDAFSEALENQLIFIRYVRSNCRSGFQAPFHDLRLLCKEEKGMVAANKFLRAALVAVFLLSATVWGLWDPNTDPCLVFNMDFETHTSSPYTATDSKAGLVGDVQNLTADANYTCWIVGPNAPNALFGTSFDIKDEVDAGNTDLTSCRLTIDRKQHVAQNANPLFKDTFTLSPTVGPNYSDTVLIYSAWLRRHDLGGTVIGQRYDNSGLNNWYWMWGFKSSKIRWDSRFNSVVTLSMETTNTLGQLGFNKDEWHQATVVVDRRSRYASRIYIDGAPVDVTILGHDPNAAYIPTDPCVFIGGGDNTIFDDFDGQLDEIRIYRHDLNDLKISLLYQWAPGFAGPYAIDPLPNYTQVSTHTGLQWVPVASATSQDLIFGDGPDLDDGNNVLVTIADLSGAATSVTNAQLGGQLDFAKAYYWRVDANNGTSFTAGPTWKFTTDVGYAFNPTPANGAVQIPITPLNLKWTGSPDANSFDVYLSDNPSSDPCDDPNNLIANDITEPNFVTTDANEKGKKYYWQVVTTIGAVTKTSAVWNFRTVPIPIVVNTSDFTETFTVDNNDYPAKTMTFTDSSHSTITATLGSDDVAIFDFGTGDVNITQQYQIYVIPLFNHTVQDEANGLAVRQTSRPMAIHVDGNFIFDGVMDISGETVTSTVSNKGYSPYGRCGGYRGERNLDGDTKVSVEETEYDGIWHAEDTNDRFDDKVVTSPENKTKFAHFITRVVGSDPNTGTKYRASGYSMFGPGAGTSAPYCVGGGGGYGGIGGDSGNGYVYGDFGGGVPYGDKEVPVPFGGSSGGGGKNSPEPSPGGSGGGGVEIAATGNVTLGHNAEITAEGGSAYSGADYGGGGGAGGSVRIIADGSVTNNGLINANGGNGADSKHGTNSQAKAGGGGAGGRVAIWYGSSYTNNGTITADGGQPGMGLSAGETYAEAGQAGTILVSNGDPRKASAPTPRDGDKIVYVTAADSNVTLKWYSGYGAQDVCDVVYYTTVAGQNPNIQVGLPVTATRGQHASTAKLHVATGVTYYWKVVTAGTVSSDVWSFQVVNYYCDPTKFNQRAQWDVGPYNNCHVDLEDFAYFAQFWFARGQMQFGANGAGIQKFMDEWFMDTGRSN
jgi:hypothetical protein